jgi:hypothetical protein
MVLVMAVDALGLPKASDVLAGLFDYVPRVIAALLVLVVAVFLASFVAAIVQTAAGNAKMPRPEILAGLTRWAIVIFAATVALVELGITPLLVTTTFNIILAGLCLALALAFGLGSKDIVAKWLEDIRRKYS